MPFDHASRLAVVIPAYRPAPGLVDVVRSLSQKGLPAIVIVDDGGGPDFRDTFCAAAALPNVEVLRHAVNLGKGAALKTAFNHVLCTFPGLSAWSPRMPTGSTIRTISSGWPTASRSGPILSCSAPRFRRRGSPAEPRRQRRHARHHACAARPENSPIPRPGLRGIPAALLPRLLRMESTGYEFELEMLLAAHHLAIPVVEEPIRTIYEPGNLSSHFNPVIDSMKIYFVLLRFGSVSLVTALIDNLVFILARHAARHVLASQVLAPCSRDCVQLLDGA